jgi:hypothetical protein
MDMDDNEKFIFEKVIGNEKLIAGFWVNSVDESTWQFFQIEPQDREGDLMITHKIPQTSAQHLKYRIIWVNDNLVFVDIIYPSLPMKEQCQIWITDKQLKIAWPPTNNSKEQQYLFLDKQ